MTALSLLLLAAYCAWRWAPLTIIGMWINFLTTARNHMAGWTYTAYRAEQRIEAERRAKRIGK